MNEYPVIEWITLLPEDIQSKFWQNVKAQNNARSLEFRRKRSATTWAKALCRDIVWFNTPEGYKYWHTILSNAEDGLYGSPSPKQTNPKEEGKETPPSFIGLS